MQTSVVEHTPVIAPVEKPVILVKPSLPTPSTSPLSSGRVPSPETFSQWTDLPKEAHHKRGQIFARTHQVMRHKTDRMLVNASRGYEREGHVPTNFTQPPLLKRRYSLDIVTKNWRKKYNFHTSHLRGWAAEDIEVSLSSIIPNPPDQQIVDGLASHSRLKHW
jgi:hypothetical protein